MSETLTEEQKISAAKNEWGKTFRLGDREFEIKDLGYFDYLEFVSLVRPLIGVITEGLQLGDAGGELNLNFDPASIDLDKILGLCGKELPKMAQLVCKQTDPKNKAEEVAELARRPQRLVEVVLMQIMHNKMIEEFGNFFTRLTSMVTVLMPDVAKATAPSVVPTESMTEETLSS